GDPEPLWYRVAALACWIEDVLEPGPGIVELLVLTQELRDVEGDVVERFPVVDRVRGVGSEIEELAVLTGDVVVVPPDGRYEGLIALLEAEDLCAARVYLVRVLLQVGIVEQVEPATCELVPEQPREGVVEDMEVVAFLVWHRARVGGNYRRERAPGLVVLLALDVV